MASRSPISAPAKPDPSQERADHGSAARHVATPRWLTEAENAVWLANAAIMIRLPAALDSRMQRETGLTFFEYMVLSTLSEAEERTMRMSALASRTSASPSRLSHVANRLEQRGLLTRCRVPGSGRRTAATLSDAGWRTVVEVAPTHVAAVRDLFIDALDSADLPALERIGRAVGACLDRAERADESS